MYRERPSRLPGAFVWSGNSGGETRVLPDGCMDLIYRDGSITIAGPDTRAHVVDGEQWSTAIGLRFAPGCAPRVIGIPAHELADLRVSLGDIWTSRATRHAVERLLESDDPGAVLEDIAIEHGVRADDPDALLVDHVTQQVRSGDSVTAIAATVGLSTRQLHRRCRDAFGYGAKTLSRILRMTRALDMARAGTTLAAAAAQAGYADQAHFSREVKELTDVTLGQLVAPSGNPAGNSAYRSTE